MIYFQLVVSMLAWQQSIRCLFFVSFIETLRVVVCMTQLTRTCCRCLVWAMQQRVPSLSQLNFQKFALTILSQVLRCFVHYLLRRKFKVQRRTVVLRGCYLTRSCFEFLPSCFFFEARCYVFRWCHSSHVLVFSIM